MKNPQTPWNPYPTVSVIDRTAFVHPEASVIGAVKIGAYVMVSPFASLRGDEGMPILIGDNSNVQDGVVVHGPAVVGDDTFVGMQAFVFKSHVGKGCVLEPKSAAIGVDIPDRKYIPAGMVVTTPEQVSQLKDIYEGYPYQHTNEAVVYVNTNLAKGYNKAAH